MSTGARFVTGFAAGVFGLIIGLGSLFLGLDQADRLKAPAFANRMSFDEKLRVLRHGPPARIEILMVGSSTTLHGLDGELLRQVLGIQGAAANLGVQDLRINQARFLTDQFLSVYPQITQIVMVSTMLDFKECSDTVASFFNPEQVKRYLSRALPEIFYQFKYLDLDGVLKQASSIKHLRGTTEDLESVSFGRDGSLLLTVPRDRINQRVWLGDPITLDPTCYQSLHALAEDLRRARLPFTYVIAPMRPGYLASRDPNGARLAEHRLRLREQLAGTGVLVIDAHAALAMPEGAFFDAYHLNRDQAQNLTRYIGAQMALRAPRDDQPARPDGPTERPPRPDLIPQARSQQPMGPLAFGG